ncbi:Uncharacterised protein [uncultured archaeon]|nr:Uncharacterised protein [uncultured archaeon]
MSIYRDQYDGMDIGLKNIIKAGLVGLVFALTIPTGVKIYQHHRNKTNNEYNQTKNIRGVENRTYQSNSDLHIKTL